MGRNPKSDKKNQKVKRRRKVNSVENLNSGSRKGSFATQRNSVGCGIFTTLQNSYSAPLFSLFALLSFWDLICNNEFNSGSSCLN